MSLAEKLRELNLIPQPAIVAKALKSIALGAITEMLPIPFAYGRFDFCDHGQRLSRLKRYATGVMV